MQPRKDILTAAVFGLLIMHRPQTRRYHGKQMLEGDVPSAKLTAVVEPYFLGPGADSPPGQAFKTWADEMAAEHGTIFVNDVKDLNIEVRLSSFLPSQ